MKSISALPYKNLWKTSAAKLQDALRSFQKNNKRDVLQIIA